MKAPNKVKWNIKDVYNVFVATFLIELFIFIIINFSGAAEFVSRLDDTSYLRTLTVFGLYLLQTAGILLPLWYFAIRKYDLGIYAFNFRWIGTFKTIMWVIVSYVFYIGFSVFVIVLFYNLGIGAFGFEPQQPIFEIFGDNVFGFVSAFIVAIIIAPLVEEIYFRGFILQTLAKKIGPVWGILLTALIFAAVHFQFQSIMPLLILSVILNVLYLRTNSIWPGIIFHIFNNSIAFALTYLFI
jgi:hypothetical protein